MSHDLNDLLKGWPHEPGQVKVRKIVGSDGREKLQLRLDLGLIQMETTGRPDGQRPHNCESLLVWHQRRAKKAEDAGDDFELTEQEVGELQQEGIQFYHRYISFFQISNYDGVLRDTERNLEMFAFVSQYAPDDEAAWAVEQFTPYVLMMHTRAKAAIELEGDDFAGAVREIEAGIDRLHTFYEETGNSDMIASSSELGFLREWLDEVHAKKPLSPLEKLQRDLDRAIASEAYEKAAELRDAIKAFAQKRD